MSSPEVRESAGEHHPPPFWMAAALLGIAGWVDAVGFLHFHHVFVSFMSGNTTLMAVSLGSEVWADAGTIVLFVVVFVLGVFAGTLVSAWAGRWRLPAIFGVEALLLGLSLLLPRSVAAFPVVLAMGWQNASLQQVGRKNLSLTYVTGTLVALGRELADAVRGIGSRWAWVDDLLFWSAMAAGAIGGAASYAWLGFQALVVPAGAVVLLAALACLLQRRSGQ